MAAPDIDGIKIGHAQDESAGTGVTVIICEKGAVGAVDVRGGGPATRETDLLKPENSVSSVNAIVLSGGSAFGLDASSGVMRYMEENGFGFPTGILNVPIVCGASLFDLGVGDPHTRPDADMGYAACKAAGPISQSPEGNVGAGMGATVGKMAGPNFAMKTGVGISGQEIASLGLKVVAISATNALGTVVDADGTPIAGVVSPDGSTIQTPIESVTNMMAAMAAAAGQAGQAAAASVENTTISCVITNATLTKAECMKVASMAHDGYARSIEPVHTSMDGDTIFVLATGEVRAPMDAVGIFAARSCEEAIRRSARMAGPAFGLKCAADMAKR